MNICHYIPGAAFIICSVLLINCSGGKSETHSVSFTKTDTVAERYLELQDSMLTAWNRMINDDNLKIKAMKDLLHELAVGSKYDPEVVAALEQRIDQLSRIRYTPRTMANTDVVDEYDFASNSIVSELISISEAQTSFAYNATMQGLVEKIRAADQRIEIYREEYDQIANEFNEFVAKNHQYIVEIEGDSIYKKPLFQVVSSE